MPNYQKKYHNIFLIFILLITIHFISSCENKKNDDYSPQFSETEPFKQSLNIYVFGVHPLHNPERLFAVYQPLVDYINKNSTGYKLKLEASRNYAEFDKKLFGGELDFALPNPYQTVISIERGYNVFAKVGNDEDFRGIILIRKDSKINSFADLKGKRISYPAPTALAACMMPQWLLYENGIDVIYDIKNIYVGSQESSIMNVFYKEVDAGVTWPPPWRALLKEKPELGEALEVKWQTDTLPNNSFVAKNDMPKHTVNHIKYLLVNLHHHEEGKVILSRIETPCFEAADNNTYEPVKKFIKKFELYIRNPMEAK